MKYFEIRVEFSATMNEDEISSPETGALLTTEGQVRERILDTLESIFGDRIDESHVEVMDITGLIKQ